MIGIEVMTERAMVERAVVEYLANALWQIPLLAGGAWLLLVAGRAGPRMQYGVWLAALGLAVMLPLHGMGGGMAATVQARSVALDSHAQAASERPIRIAPAKERGGVGSPARPRSVVVPEAAARWMAGLYAGMVIFGLSRVIRAWREARRLVAGSREISLAGEHTVVLEEYGRRLRIRLPEVRESVEISSPMIVGAAAPVLLLPERFAEHGREEIRAALLHELAHVRRRDYLVNAMCQVAALPVAWHPATHWVQGRIRRTREMACDEMAAEEMRSEIGYAQCLLGLAKGMLAGRDLGRSKLGRQAAGVELFSDNVLEARVMRLMETKTAMRVRTKVIRAASGAMAMAATGAMAVMFHVTPTLAASQGAELQAEVAASAQAPVAPVTPVAPVAPVAPAAPVAPVAPAAPKAPVVPVAPPAPAAAKGAVAQHWHSADGDSFTIVNGERRAMTPEEKRCANAAMAKARRAIADATAKLNSPEFKKQMVDAQAQAAKAREMIDSPEFKKQIADAQAQAARAREFVNSAKFKEEMDEVRKANETLKLQMPNLQIDLRRSMAQIDSPEFRRQMQEAQKINLTEVQRSVDEAMRRLNEQLHEDVQAK